MLRSWTPITALNLQRDDSLAFDILDHVVEDVDSLEKELQQSVWRQMLRPATTQGDYKMNDIVSMLGNATTITGPPPSIRGDKIIFITRKERMQNQFASTNPCLCSFIESIHATTAQHYLKDLFDLDFSQTSVQLAVYPGDGTSGYPRHCDQSKQLPQANERQRMITCVYYLTPSDWNSNDDDGALRLFSDSSDYDVIPYRNRMVVFRSDLIEHQVMPSLRRERMALTVWLYGRPPPPPRHDVTIATIHSPVCNTIMAGEQIDNSSPKPLPVEEEASSAATTTTIAHKDSTIFVSIAAYRDSELGPTLNSLVSTAQYVNRVHVGIVLQWDQSVDQHILANLLPLLDSSSSSSASSSSSWFVSNVCILQMDSRHARGPCYARDLCQRLYNGQDYILQIDSHMRFRPNWDTYLIHQLHKCPSPQTSVLTAYPVGYELANRIPDETRGTLLVPWKFDDNGMLRQRGRLFLKKSKGEDNDDNNNVPCFLYAAGFNFGSSKVLEDCPYDGRLQHLFFGEEISMAVRLFTHGYNLYAPPQTVVYHLWSRAHRPVPLQDVSSSSSSSSSSVQDQQRQRRQAQKEAAHKIVLDQLLLKGQYDHSNGGSSVTRRGLGTVRTVSEFAKSLRVDFETQTIHQGAELGCLQEDDFVDNTTTTINNNDNMTLLLSPMSLENQVKLLHSKPQAMIASFLTQLNSSS